MIARVLAIGSTVLLTVTGCAFQGVNSLPLAWNCRTRQRCGRVPRRGREHRYAGIEFAGSDRRRRCRQRRQDDVARLARRRRRVAEAGCRRACQCGGHCGTDQPARVDARGARSSAGTSAGAADCKPGATIGLDSSSTYPSTERTLSSLAAVVNGGGLGQIGDIVHNFNEALSGRQDAVRDLITRLDTFVGTLYQQRDNIIATIDELNRFSATLGGQQEVLTRALNKIPPALDVLIKERPRITTALEHLGTFSETVRRRGQRHAGRPRQEPAEPRTDSARRSRTSARRSTPHLRTSRRSR